MLSLVGNTNLCEVFNSIPHGCGGVSYASIILDTPQVREKCVHAM